MALDMSNSQISNFLITSPVYSNKWNFYVQKITKIDGNVCDQKALDFCWFSCAKPYVDDKGVQVIQVGNNTLFFDKNSGKSYYVKYDANPCLLRILDNSPGNIIQQYLKGFSPSKEYCGVAIHDKNIKCNDNDLIYAQTHYSALKNTKGFPSEKDIKNAKPGKISLAIRNVLKIV